MEDNVYRRELDGVGGTLSFSRGVSMLPLIRQGRGYVSIVKVDEPAVGDILAFEHMRHGKKVNIMHRLVEIRPDGVYVARGDNCLNCEFIHREDIMGRADRIFWTKDAGRLMPWLLGARRDLNGGYQISVTDPGYLRYVRVWNALWPIRRLWYRTRIAAHSRLGRIGWLRRLYHKFSRK